MKRFPDWRLRLMAYVTDWRDREFRPGRSDCALFAAGAVEAMTGVDPAADFRGRYRTIDEGLALVGPAGHVGHAATLFPEISPMRAQVGDLAEVEGDGGPALGVVIGPQIAAMGLDGLRFVFLTDARRAFHV